MPDRMSSERDTHDNEAAPQLALSFVSSLDILGTQAHTAKQLQSTLELTARAIERAHTWTDNGAKSKTVARWFSDNLALADLVPATVGSGHAGESAVLHLMSIAGVQAELACDGLFSRGGVTIGPFFANESFVYGPALVEAYKLESTVATYPRVVVAPSFQRYSIEELKWMGGDDDDPIRTWLAVDRDGLVFVNYLAAIWNEEAVSESLLLRHRAHIAAQLDAHLGNPYIHLKYQWLADYHDRFCRTWWDVAALDDVTIGSRDGPTLEHFGTEVPVSRFRLKQSGFHPRVPSALDMEIGGRTDRARPVPRFRTPRRTR